MERKMFLGASPGVFKRARELRENETEQEVMLWNYLKAKPLGFKFRRQHPIKQFVADFYCHSAKLVIEADGGIHDKVSVKQYDDDRQQLLEDEGIAFLRFANETIDGDFENVKLEIEEFLRNLPPLKQTPAP